MVVNETFYYNASVGSFYFFSSLKKYTKMFFLLRIRKEGVRPSHPFNKVVNDSYKNMKHHYQDIYLYEKIVIKQYSGGKGL